MALVPMPLQEEHNAMHHSSSTAAACMARSVAYRGGDALAARAASAPVLAFRRLSGTLPTVGMPVLPSSASVVTLMSRNST